jgi:hypothetical protein
MGAEFSLFETRAAQFGVKGGQLIPAQIDFGTGSLNGVRLLSTLVKAFIELSNRSL